MSDVRESIKLKVKSLSEEKEVNLSKIEEFKQAISMLVGRNIGIDSSINTLSELLKDLDKGKGSGDEK